MVAVQSFHSFHLPEIVASGSVCTAWNLFPDPHGDRRVAIVGEHIGALPFGTYAVKNSAAQGVARSIMQVRPAGLSQSPG